MPLRERIREYTLSIESEPCLEMPAPDTGYFIGPVIFSEVSPPPLPLLKKKFWPSWVAVLRVKISLRSDRGC